MQLSVIIPVFNAGKYIEKCINSLLEQTIIDDMEIIVVDDHGNDNSLEIIDYIKTNHKKGNHIKIYSTEENSGAYAARNYGLKVAIGKYIGFCDADDWVERNMYEELLDNAKKHDADLAYCGGQKEFENNQSEKLVQVSLKGTTLDESIKKHIFANGIAYFSTAIYKKDFLDHHSIEFPKGKFSEDSFFWWLVIMKAKSACYVDMIGYHYQIQQNSVSKRPDCLKARQKQLMYSKLLNYFRETNEYLPYKEELDFLYIKKGYLIPLIIESINNQSQNLKIFRLQLNKDGILLLKNKYVWKNCKILILLFAFYFIPKSTAKILKLKYTTDPF